MTDLDLRGRDLVLKVSEVATILKCSPRKGGTTTTTAWLLLALWLR